MKDKQEILCLLVINIKDEINLEVFDNNVLELSEKDYNYDITKIVI